VTTITDQEIMRALAFGAAQGIYCAGEDSIRVTSLSNAAGAVVLSGRFLACTGEIVPFEHRHSLGNDRSIAATLVSRLGEGWLLSLSAALDAGTLASGQAWARVDVIRGEAANGTTLATLIQGTLTDTHRRAWPGSPIATSIEGAGVIRTVLGADPAAGAEWSEPVPAGARWRLRSVIATLTTDATAAARLAALQITDGTNTLWRARASQAQAASIAGIYSGGGTGYATTGATNDLMWPIPSEMILLAGFRIGTFTSSLQAGDDWSAPRLTVEEWIEGA
jgi:hypothetical protein